MNKDQLRAHLKMRPQLPCHPLPPAFKERDLETADQRAKAAEALIQWSKDFRQKWLSVIGPLYPYRQKGRSRRGWTVPPK